MPVNTTKSDLVFRETGDRLNILAKSAGKDAAEMMRETYPMPLGEAPTRGMSQSAKHFLEMMDRAVSGKDFPALDEEYFQAALRLALEKSDGETSDDLAEKLSGRPARDATGFRKAHINATRKGFSCWLLALRSKKALTLPFAFGLPFSREQDASSAAREDIGSEHYGELLGFIRGIQLNANVPSADPILNDLPYFKQDKLLGYGSKTLLALGWLDAKDANLEDMVELWKAFAGKGSALTGIPPWSMLLDVFEKKFGDEFRLLSERFKAETKRIANSSISKTLTGVATKKARASKGNQQEKKSPRSANEKLLARNFGVDVFLQEGTFPLAKSLDPDKARVWVEIENAYLSKVRKENYATIRGTLGYLNAYLFGDLWGWYEANGSFDLPFPSEPSKLKAGVFVSRLLARKGARLPKTLLEFLSDLSVEREWEPATLYAHIKILEKFFGFVERMRDDLPGCQGFSQPIGEHDFPRVARSLGTNKGLIPRSVFGFMLSYLLSLSAYAEALGEKALSQPGGLGEILGRGSSSGKAVPILDAWALQDDVGFLPMMWWEGKRIALKKVPNVFALDTMKVASALNADGEGKLIPRPHLIAHFIVALQTGLRGNHIQWLDADSFDRFAKDGESFTKLWVNTDKTKSSGWTPYVSSVVIEELRKQRRWRERVAEKGFQEQRYYNENPQSKWGKIKPLFSFYANGKVYPDQIYHAAWKELVMAVQWTMREAGIACPTIARLAPSGVAFDDPAADSKLKKIGAANDSYTPLSIVTEISPHSARVSVVSHYISALPSEFIGKYVTGQNPAVVAHYVKLDPDALHRESQIQAFEAEKRQLDEAFEYLKSGKMPPGIIQADAPDSALMRGFAENPTAAMALFGCVSVGSPIEGVAGVDILGEAVGRNAAFNKTEICPHGNQCPQDVIRELKGRGRCGLCPRAVRSIDHLPAVAARCRQAFEEMQALDARMEKLANSLSASDLEALASQRDSSAEELVGWIVSLETLEGARQDLSAKGGERSTLISQTPEILSRELSRVSVPTNPTKYLLSRIPECLAYPNLQSERARAQMDILRRNLLARMGDFQKAFDQAIPEDAASECAGLLRSIALAHNLTLDDFARILEGNIPTNQQFGFPKMLGLEDTEE